MKLQQLEQSVNAVILERGIDYWEEGYVNLLTEEEPLCFHAEVEGSELYDVDVRIDASGKVLATSCDCPYDYGPICKHIVAVLLEIRNEYFHKGEMTAAAASSSASKLTIAEQLALMSKEDLVELLVEFSKEHREVRKELLLKLSTTNDAQFYEQCRSMIRSSINRYMNNDAPYWQVSAALKGAQKVLTLAEEALGRQEISRALETGLIVFHEMIGFQQESDDPEGDIHVLIEESLHVIIRIEEQIPETEELLRTAVFQRLLEEAAYPDLEGGEEWRLAFFETASSYIDSHEMRKQWNDVLDRMEEEIVARSPYHSYFVERAAMLRHKDSTRRRGEAGEGIYAEPPSFAGISRNGY
ncbi:SWIM zinc finger domain-containing protein [Paenibacillus sp. GCM10027626]|uniref:SWIM zinc finger family protein n=1 Tax=Paenibacillus sp. GCM10027626 TaxID=3273411 RepID=UPI003628537D